jgi:hypothetical protein
VVVGHGGRVADDVVLEGLGHRPQPGQRGPQVVGDPGDQVAPAGFELSFALAGLGGPDRRGGEPVAEGGTHAQADRRGGSHGDQHDLQVMRGEEHGVRNGRDARDDGRDGDREQHAHVQDDRPLVEQPERDLTDHPDHGAGGQGVDTDQHQVTHGRTPARSDSPRPRR